MCSQTCSNRQCKGYEEIFYLDNLGGFQLNLQPLSNTNSFRNGKTKIMESLLNRRLGWLSLVVTMSVSVRFCDTNNSM